MIQTNISVQESCCKDTFDITVTLNVVTIRCRQEVFSFSSKHWNELSVTIGRCIQQYYAAVELTQDIRIK
jgi:hypothetical protein